MSHGTRALRRAADSSSSRLYDDTAIDNAFACPCAAVACDPASAPQVSKYALATGPTRSPRVSDCSPAAARRLRAARRLSACSSQVVETELRIQRLTLK